MAALGRLFPFIAILHDANDLADETEQSKYFDECHSNHSLPGAWIRPPTVFRYALRALVYHICRGLSNLRNVKKALDISVQMAYNKREEGIPVDGLLPLFELKRFNRHSLQLGAVISFSSCDHGCHVFYTMKR